MNPDYYAKIIWDYVKLDQPLEKCDAILVLGSHDVIPAQYGIDLFKKGYGEYLIFAGGGIQNKPEDGIVFNKVEAEEYADMAHNEGIPKESVIIENKSTNTGENFTFTGKILKEKDLKLSSFLIVQKPYDERRLTAVAAKLWPDKKVVVTSKPTTYEEYTSGSIPKERVLNSIVGIVQRIKIYGQNGFQIPQEIPPTVWEAYEKLVAMGFDKRLVKG